MYDDICTLLKMTVTTSTAGDPVETISTSGSYDVFCEVVSASWRDKQMAESRGKKAELTLKLSDRYDYADQRFLTYDSKNYEVVDTYYDDRSRELRLVVGRWQGQ